MLTIRIVDTVKTILLEIVHMTCTDYILDTVKTILLEIVHTIALFSFSFSFSLYIQLMLLLYYVVSPISMTHHTLIQVHIECQKRLNFMQLSISFQV